MKKYSSGEDDVRKHLIFSAATLSLAVVAVTREPAPGDGGLGSFRYLSTQPDDPSTPITYSSCKQIRVEINTEGIDDEATAKQLVLEAMGEISAASHLQLVYAGPTERRPRFPQNVLGGAWPVLVSFATAEEVPRLEGPVAGVGGSSPAFVGGVLMYVTGQATLDSDYVNERLQVPRDRDQVRAVAMHELGHVVGLGHAPDGREIMNASSYGGTELGPGDRRGLAVMGQGPCT